MNKEEMVSKCKKLLDTEDEIIRVQNTARRKLPDVEAAKKRVAAARTKRILGIILVAAVLVLFFPVRSSIKEWSSSLEGFSIMPTLATLAVWAAMFFMVCGSMVLLAGAPSSDDVNAEKIRRDNENYNANLDGKEAALKKEQKVQVEELNRLAGTSYAAARPRYFFQIPFDSRQQSYRDLKDGMDFYKNPGNEFYQSMLAGPVLIHDPKLPGRNRHHLRVDGFYYSKRCKAEEALSLLENGRYVSVYRDDEYLRSHPEENCRLFCIWDTMSEPVKNQGFFKMREMELQDVAKGLAATWSEPQQFMASGIAAYDGYLTCQESIVEDTRDGEAQKFTAKLQYDDVGSIKQGWNENTLAMMNAVTCYMLEKGFVLSDQSGKRLLYVGLTNTPVYIQKIAYNLAQYEYKDWERFHGYLCGLGVEDKKCVPGKASTMDFLASFMNIEFAVFDPMMECPEGLTREQFRYWISCWRRGWQRQHKGQK